MSVSPTGDDKNDDKSDDGQIDARCDALCDAFEAAWRRGERPRIEDAIAGLAEPTRHAALRELIRVEAELRGKAGDPLFAEAYAGRFPDSPRAVADAFAERDSTVLETVAHPPHPSGVHFRCPHCQNQIELVADADLESVDCPSCGEAFTISGGRALAEGEPLERTFAHFELIERLGLGAFGSVWKAQDTRLDRVVAIKFPRKGQLNAKEAESFMREARAAAQLKHRSIVGVHEVGRHDDRLYIVSDFVPGGSLEERLRDGPIAQREAAELGAELADALHHAHEQGVVHRDLKPANLLLDESGNPLIADFGLAKRDAGEIAMTIEGQLLGTPAYMSPEQASGEAHRAGPRSDVYSLGVVLFHMITGELPFRGDVRMLLKQVIEDEPPTPRRLNGVISRDLETICLKCLAKRPDGRYASSAALGKDLRRYLAGEPIHARPVSAIERIGRWCRRKPMVAGLAASVALLLVSIAIAGPAVAWRQSVLRQRAESNEAKAARLALSEQEEREKAEIAKRAAQEARRKVVQQKARADRTLYARTVSLAYQEWRRDNVHRAEDLLDQADQRFRGWEWDFVKQLCNAEDLTIRGHAGMPHRLRMTADGSRIVSFGRAPDWNVYVWDAASGAKLHEHPYRGFAISRDGSLVAVEQTSDGPVVIIDAVTGDQRARLSGHEGGTNNAGFNSDGTRLVTNGPDRTIRVWDLATEEPIVEIADEPERLVSPVSFSDGDRYIVHRRWADGRVRLHDAVSGELVREIEDPNYRKEEARVAVSPDGGVLATGANGPIDLFDVATGTLVGSLRGHRGVVYGLDFSDDGKRLASCGVDQTVRVWDVAQRRELLRCRGHKAGMIYGVLDVAFGPDGRRVVSAGADTTIKVWSAAAGEADATARSEAFRALPGGREAAAVYPDPSFEKRWLAGGRRGVAEVAFSPDGALVAAANQDGCVRVYDTQTNRLLRTYREHRRNVGAVAFHPTEPWIASAGGGIADVRTGRVRVWNHRTGETIRTIDGFIGPVSVLCFSRDGGRLYAGVGSQREVRSGEVVCCDTSTGERVFRIAGLGGVRDVDLSPDERAIAVASYGRLLRLYDTAKGTLTREFGSSVNTYSSVAFSPDGKRVAAGSNRWQVSLFDRDSGETVWSQVEHSGAVMGIAFSPDGSRLVSGSVDRTTKVWDTHSGDVLLDLAGDAFECHGVAFSPDGRTIASFGEAPYVALRSLADPRGGDPQADPWQVVFADDFDREELGDEWTTPNGRWAIEDGVARGVLTPLAVAPTIGVASMMRPAAIPARAEIAFDAWAPERATFESALLTHALDGGWTSVFLGRRSVWNQGRRGMAVVMVSGGGYSEVSRVAWPEWFEPGVRYRLRVRREGDRVAMFVDDVPVLESTVPGSLWTPNVLLQGSGAPGQLVSIDNVEVRAPASTAGEIKAIKLVAELRGRLKLKEFVIHEIRRRADLSQEERSMAVEYAERATLPPAIREELLDDALRSGDTPPEAFAALAEALQLVADGVDGEEADTGNTKGVGLGGRSAVGDARCRLAAALYRAGDFDAAIDAAERANRVFERATGMPHPMAVAIVVLSCVALDDTDGAQQSAAELREMLRSVDWHADEEATAWAALVAEETTASDDTPASAADDAEQIKGVTHRAMQDAYRDHDPAALIALHDEQAVVVQGRSAEPTEWDVSTTMPVWQRVLRLQTQGPPQLGSRFARLRAELDLNGDSAELRSTYVRTTPRAHWRWESREELERRDGEWRIVGRRDGVTHVRDDTGDSWRVDGDWTQADAEYEANKDAAPDDDGFWDPFLAKLYAWRLADSYEQNKRRCEAPDADADHWASLAERALRNLDPDTMESAARRAVAVDPSGKSYDWVSEWAPFVWCYVAERRFRTDARDLGSGVRVRPPQRARSVSPRDANLPKALAVWRLSSRSATGVVPTDSLVEGARDAEAAASRFAEQVTVRFGAPVVRRARRTVDGLPAAEVVFDGSDPAIAGRAGSMFVGGTVQRWLFVERETGSMAFFLSATPQEYDRRNTEFEVMLEHAELTGDAMSEPGVASLLKLAKSSDDGVRLAIKIAREADPAELKEPLTLLVMGELLLIAGEPERAAAIIAKAIDSGGDEHWYDKSLGWALAARGSDAEAAEAFQRGLDKVGEFRPKTLTQDIDYWVCAYFKDLVSESQLVERWRDDSSSGSRDACLAWFYIAQRAEIEGRLADARRGYEASVRAARVPGANPIHRWSAYRLRALREAERDLPDSGAGASTELTKQSSDDGVDP
ncbi:MAG: protein kinase [Planctomycetota bacterium]